VKLAVQFFIVLVPSERLELFQVVLSVTRVVVRVVLIGRAVREARPFVIIRVSDPKHGIPLFVEHRLLWLGHEESAHISEHFTLSDDASDVQVGLDAVDTFVHQLDAEAVCTSLVATTEARLEDAAEPGVGK